MDGLLADGRTGRLWMCKKHRGHALGMIVTVQLGGRFVEGLIMFRHALAVDAAGGTIDLTNAEVLGFLEGTMHEIECDLCNNKRSWWMDRKSIAQLIAPLHGG